MKHIRPKWFAGATMDDAKPDDMMDMDDQIDDDEEMAMGHPEHMAMMGHHEHMPMCHQDHMPMMEHHEHMPMGHHDHMPMMEHHEHMPMGYHEHMPMMGHDHMMLAHAYVPWQCYHEAFCPKEALMKGTLFPELFGVYPIPQ